MGVILLPVIIIGLIIAVVGFKLAGSAGGDEEEEEYYEEEEMEGGNVLDLAEIFDIPLAKRGLTLIVVFIMLDIILKKPLRKINKTLIL